MNSILKTLIIANTQKKWFEFNQKFKSFFEGRDKKFDEILKFIDEFYSRFEVFPDFNVFESELSNNREFKLLEFVREIVKTETIPIYLDDVEFLTHVLSIEKLEFQNEVIKENNNFGSTFVTIDKRDNTTLLEQIDSHLSKLHQIKSKMLRSDENTSTLFYGEDVANSMLSLYNQIKQKRHSKESIYYDLGIKAFDSVQLKRGDLAFFMAFTSHGKSIMLRYLTYRCIIEFGLNVTFFSFEMSRDIINNLFLILHANNKQIFPNTPIISYTKLKNGELTPEEEDFLYHIVAVDFTSNKSYGTLYVDQPSKFNYSLIDLSLKLKELENTIMPVHVVALDYLSMMSPDTQSRKTPDTQDYNNMVKQFKNMALTHRNARGDISPFLALSACQASRGGLESCLKHEGVYDLSAIYLFSELEKSSDMVFSVLMTPEMKLAKQFRLQHLKNRDGEVIIKPVDLFIDLDGFSISEVQERTEAELLEVLQTISI